jgi:hypothetical protein
MVAMNWPAALAVVGLAVASMGQSKVPDPLTQARELYNAQRYSEAILMAAAARRNPESAHAASIVIARSQLERFRQTQDPIALDLARQALGAVEASGLAPRDRIELMIAFGQALYFDDVSGLDDRFGAAAEQFELALGGADLLDQPSRDRLFEWWAGAIDRQAQQGGEATRKPLYERVLRRAEQELGHANGAASAAYWLAASARGVNDLARAVGAAVAGWVRAASLGPRGEELRVDLDRLMREVILPERARELASAGDARPTLALLEQQWQAMKAKWETK